MRSVLRIVFIKKKPILGDLKEEAAQTLII